MFSNPTLVLFDLTLGIFRTKMIFSGCCAVGSALVADWPTALSRSRGSSPHTRFFYDERVR